MIRGSEQLPKEAKEEEKKIPLPPLQPVPRCEKCKKRVERDTKMCNECSIKVPPIGIMPPQANYSHPHVNKEDNEPPCPRCLEYSNGEIIVFKSECDKNGHLVPYPSYR